MRTLDIPSIVARGRVIADLHAQSNGSLVAAGLAFYTFFALAPAAVAIGAVAGVFLSPEELSRAWQDLLSRSPDSLSALQPAVNALTQVAMTASGGVALVTGVSALGVAIYAASKSVYGLRLAMTTSLSGGVPRAGLALRIISAVVALVVLIAVVVGLGLVTLLPSFLKALGLDTPAGTQVGIVNWLLVALVTWGLVFLTFRKAPVGGSNVRGTSPGVLVSVLWILGSIAAFGLYSAWSSAVGAALLVYGAPIALLLWLYLVALGLVIGAAVESALRGEPARGSGDQRGDERA
ncbi:MAG: YihY/virulence factor BrkB family protein [Actinobacteria bacterium]|nr:YihY/virulence factor BrkB family protein [Actinomycetota bacterium]